MTLRRCHGNSFFGRAMKRRKTTAEASDPPTVSAGGIAGNLSLREAKTFWQNQRKEGNVDALFKEVQSKLQLLQQKIKDGSATNQDYLRAFLLVNEANLGDHSDQSLAEELPEKEECPSVKTEEPLQIPIDAKLEEPLPCSEPEIRAAPLPFVERVHYEKHRCGKMCLSKVNPYFSKSENPLKFPVLCQFQRRHAKSGVISRQLDVIYKAPCGKSLRNFDEVYSYLVRTKCCFLSLEHFSFNTYLQLNRYLVKTQVVLEEADLSKDAELMPVPFCNEIDNSRPAPFKYRKSSWPRGYSINNFTDLFIGCCDCTDDCLDESKCACLQLTAKQIGKDPTLPKKGITPGYKHKRLQTPVPAGLYECNVSCKCDRKMCQNRVVQHGLQVRLQVFKTKDKGWGVRCLDDLDKGTFVCIFAGLILMKTVDANVSGDSRIQSDIKKTPSISPVKRKCSSHSDSEITAFPSVSSTSQKFRLAPLIRGSSQTNLKKKGLFNFKKVKLDFTGIKRPKTKTSILQKRRQKLIEEGTMTLQHSSDDEFFTPPPSPKKLRPGDCEDEDENVEVLRANRDNTDLTNEASCVSKESSSSIQSGSKEYSDPPDLSDTDENIYFLDASTEGNVGRFLNHSCSPNLFVQHVFVETHYEKFPWVAFFTKSFIKAGTELTWDYNYDIGSVPEKEISCLCGHKKCKNLIV